MSTRAQRRRLGKKRLRREAHRDVVRVIELDQAGHSAAAIASSVGLGEGLVREILERAEAARAVPPLCYAPAASPTS